MAPGRPIPIVDVTDDQQLVLHEENLATILLHPSVRNNMVCVESIAVDHRKGKSFLLNIILKSFKEQSAAFSQDVQEGGVGQESAVAAAAAAHSWITRDSPQLTPLVGGFSSRGGMRRDTRGILMWSEPFLVPHPAIPGQQVAVLLMDTQGTFDRSTSMKINTQIFALSTMLSSVLVFNLMGNLQEYDLQHLAYFVRYGTVALQESAAGSRKPFQKLIFLLRDWRFPEDFSYGRGGGAEFLRATLSADVSSGGQDCEELEIVRRQIASCFDQINCYLLPRPAEGVEKYSPLPLGSTPARPVAAGADFLQHVSALVKDLVCPANVVVKLHGGRPVTGAGLFDLAKHYYAQFTSGEIPEPRQLLQATAEANAAVAFRRAVSNFESDLERLGQDNSIAERPRDQLTALLTLLRTNAIAIYDNSPMIAYAQENSTAAAGDNFSRQELLTKLDQLTANFLARAELELDAATKQQLAAEAKQREAALTAQLAGMQAAMDNLLKGQEEDRLKHEKALSKLKADAEQETDKLRAEQEALAAEQKAEREKREQEYQARVEAAERALEEERKKSGGWWSKFLTVVGKVVDLGLKVVTVVATVGRVLKNGIKEKA